MESTKTIGDILLRLRTRKNLSQATLADRVGACQSAYQTWENNRSIPNAHFFVLLAIALEVDIRDLIPDDLRSRLVLPPLTTAPQPSQEEANAMLRMIVQLQQQQIDQLTREVELLRGKG